MDLQHGPQSNDVAERAALYALACLSGPERAEYAAHLEHCKDCQAEVEAYAVAISRFALSDPTEKGPSPTARDRLLAAIRKSGDGGSSAFPSQAEILLKRSGLLLTRPANAPWKQGPVPGLSTKILFLDEERKYATSLVRMDAGVHYPSHRHADVEEVYLLEGELNVEGQIMRPGDYCRAEPESIHQEIFTEHGCFFLVMSSQMDEVVRG